MRSILCKTCNNWVDCTREDGRPMGFCLEEDLFTYTEKTVCSDYIKGVPVTEEEWDKCEEDEKIYD